MAKTEDTTPAETFEILNGTATLTVKGGKSVLTNRGNEFCSMNPVVTLALDPEGRKLAEARRKAAL